MKARDPSVGRAGSTTQPFQDLAKGEKDNVHSTTLWPDLITSQPLTIAKAPFPQFLRFLYVPVCETLIFVYISGPVIFCYGFSVALAIQDKKQNQISSPHKPK